MTDEHGHPTTAGVFVRIGGVILAWLGSMKLGDWQALMAILSGAGVLAYTLLQIYVLWRDKIKDAA